MLRKLRAFNPILVWFYQTARRRGLRGLRTFNPILVWFYPDVAKTFEKIVTLTFNPILVWFYLLCERLKECLDFILSIPFWSDFIRKAIELDSERRAAFNPILVWFYQLLSWQSRYLYRISFNPILVWFYLATNYILSKWISFFQSHFGLILSLQKHPANQEPQLPFNPILVWFYQNNTENDTRFDRLLSIPFWSDFIKQLENLVIPTGYVFQSHFGLILSVLLLSLRLQLQLSFNPILVWFYHVRGRFWKPTNW